MKQRKGELKNQQSMFNSQITAKLDNLRNQTSTKIDKEAKTMFNYKVGRINSLYISYRREIESYVSGSCRSKDEALGKIISIKSDVDKVISNSEIEIKMLLHSISQIEYFIEELKKFEVEI